MTKLKELLGKWASMTVCLFLCLFLTRLVFALELHFRMDLEWGRSMIVLSSAWQDLFPTAFVGLVALVPFVLLGMWLPKLAKGIYIAVIVLFVLLTTMLNEYYCNMMMPLDHVVMMYSMGDLTGIVASSVVLSFSKVFWFLLTLLAPVALLIVLRRWTMRWYVAIALAVLSLVLTLSVNYRKIIREERFYGSHEDFGLAVNQLSYSYVKITDYIRKKQEDIGNDDQTIKEAAKRYQTLHSEFYFPDTEYPFYHRNDDNDVIGCFFNKTTDSLPPNFVFIIVEGFGQYLTSVDKPRLSFTPFIDSLKREGLYWKNCLSTAERTFGALPSIFASAPYGMHGFGFYLDVMPEHRSLLTDMLRNGYTTDYFYGVVTPTSRFDEFLQQNLVNYIYKPTIENVDSARYASLSENHRWGIDDRELFEYIEQYKTGHPAARPHNDIVMTITTHEPFTFDGVEKYEQKVRDIVAQTDDASSDEKKIVLGNTNVYACYIYMDECVRNLIDYYSTLPEYANTVFVITGDHRTAHKPYNSIVKYNVPLLIWSPLLKESKTMDAVTSHLCITPTLNAYLSNNYDYKTSPFNHWLAPVVDTATAFRNTLKQAFMLNNRDVTQYVNGDYFINASGLYELQEDMNLKPCDDKSIHERLKSELDDFNMLSCYAVHGNKLLNERNDLYNVMVAESYKQDDVMAADEEYHRLIKTEIKQGVSLVGVNISFDIQSEDSLSVLPTLVVTKGSFSRYIPLVSATGSPLNTGRKERFECAVVVPVNKDSENGDLKVFLWRKAETFLNLSDVRVNVLGYDPNMQSGKLWGR